MNIPFFMCYDERKALANRNYCLTTSDGAEISIENLRNETTKKIKSVYDIILDINNVPQPQPHKKFIEGFRSEIDILATQLYNLPLKLQSEIICGINNLTFEIFEQHLTFENFDDNEKNILLNLIKNKYMDNPEYLEILLLTMTGSSRIPALGYVKYPLKIEKMSFVAYDVKPYDIHTCFNHMEINRDLFNIFKLANPDRQKETEFYKAFDIEYLRKISQFFNIT
jgi:hypothetical protein